MSDSRPQTTDDDGPWKRDGRTVYRLMVDRWRGPEPVMTNEFTIRVDHGPLRDAWLAEKLAEEIRPLLNEDYHRA